MALSDPFSTTYQGSMQAGESLGQGINQAAGSIAQVLMQHKQNQTIRKQGQQLLQQFGLLNPDGSINAEKAKSAGVEMSSDGSVKIKPMQQLPTLAQQIQEIQALDEAKKRGDVSPTTGYNIGKGGLQLKSTPSAKGGVLSQLGIDTEGKTTEQLQTEIQTKNPALSTYLKRVGNNELPIRGSFGMSYNQVTELVSSLYPQYNPLDYMAKEASVKNASPQDAKVNQAIHLRGLADQYYDTNTGNYNVPQAQYSELVIGLANLVANSNIATDTMRKEINQRTAAGDMNGLASYLTGTPRNASTQKMIKNLIDSIDRQGKIAEGERTAYIGKGTFGNSFNDFLSKSPSKQKLNLPKGAVYYSPSTGKYYDAKKNEVNNANSQ